MGRGLRAALCLLAAAAALAICGCGGGGSSSTQGQGQAPGQGGASSPRSSASEADQGSAKHYEGGEESIEGFGEEAEGPERAAILAAFDGELVALAGKDYAKACSYLSQAVHESLAQLSAKKTDCATLLSALLSPSAPAVARGQADGEVTKVRVEGDRGFVVFHAPGAKLYQQTMVREDGEWKAATLASSILVPTLPAPG